jgi:uncharacterized protein (DUF169 family)
MKKPIHYTIIDRFNPRVMAVTTVTGRQVYGRWADTDETTHHGSYKAKGIFKTRSEAQRVVAAVAKVRAAHKLKAKPLEAAMLQLSRDTDAAITRIINKATGLTEL